MEQAGDLVRRDADMEQMADGGLDACAEEALAKGREEQASALLRELDVFEN